MDSVRNEEGKEYIQTGEGVSMSEPCSIECTNDEVLSVIDRKVDWSVRTPERELLKRYTKWLDRRGFFREDLQVDYDHQIDTFLNDGYNREELKRLRANYEFEVSLYESKGDVITFGEWLHRQGYVNPLILDADEMKSVDSDISKIVSDNLFDMV